MNRIVWEWPAAIVFGIVFATLGGLVYFGKLTPEVLLAVLAWLAPAPYQSKTLAPRTELNGGHP